MAENRKDENGPVINFFGYVLAGLLPGIVAAFLVSSGREDEGGPSLTTWELIKVALFFSAVFWVIFGVVRFFKKN